MIQKLDKGTENAHDIINENFENVEVEYGNNEHGHWEKHPNGVLECWGKVNISAGSSTFFALNLPHFFIDDEAYVDCGAVGYNQRELVVNGYVIGGGVRIEGYVYSVGGTSKPNIEFPAQFYAIGRWK